MNKKKTVLLTGANSLIAPYIIEGLKDKYEVITTSRTKNKNKCDLTNQNDVINLVRDINPGVVIHAAALTDIDLCEQKPKLAFLVNVMSTYNIVSSISEKSKFIYISTDQVYYGSHNLNQEDCVSPINSYGRTKLGGELAALSHHNTCILRTNFFGKSRHKNKQTLSDFFINGFKNEDELKLFKDLYFSPLHLSTLSSVIRDVIEHNLNGIFNMGSRNGCTKADFARKIALHLGYDKLNAIDVDSEDIASRAIRPKKLRMDVSRLEGKLGYSMPLLEDEIKKL